jgi:hypothetical protein
MDLEPPILLGWLKSISHNLSALGTVDPRPHMHRGRPEMKLAELSTFTRVLRAVTSHLVDGRLDMGASVLRNRD